jgi:hypothetical protein
MDAGLYAGILALAKKRREEMRQLLIALLLLLPLPVQAQETDSKSRTGPLFMKDLLGDREFFAPWGVGIDVFTMGQDYSISSLEFQLPGAGEIDPSKVGVTNDVQAFDIKLDVWVTPFLNVFGLVGRMDADTFVDLSSVTIPGLPVALPTLPVAYDGTVYGFGFNLFYGTDRWFAALNNTWTDTSLSGDFDSSVSSFTMQPKLGLIVDGWTAWVGGMYLDTDEKHSGVIQLPIPNLPPVPFKVELESLEKWNYAVGFGKIFSPRATLFLEIGFGDRNHTLFNFTYRF